MSNLLCNCGSGEYKEAQFDGHGIFLCYTCDKCYTEKMKGFRNDIHSAYDCDEDIEPDSPVELDGQYCDSVYDNEYDFGGES